MVTLTCYLNTQTDGSANLFEDLVETDDANNGLMRKNSYALDISLVENQVVMY